MMSAAGPTTLRVLKFVQELILDDQGQTAITPAGIAAKIEMVLAMKPSWSEGLDRNHVTDELIRRFSLWIGTDTTLSSGEGHIAWLTADRRRDWRYWQRYREWTESKLSWNAAEALDRSTDLVLSLLEDPRRADVWDRRGLVVGHVQSGKTGHYTGLICKAADAGYKIIVVLAGLHNNLRAQTQVRLDEGFLGYATSPTPDVLQFVGVGANGQDAAIKPNCATNRTENGDFNKKVARHLAITPEQRPWLFVVKKNKTVLKYLLDWINHHVADAVDASGRHVVTQLPLLVIDDEADHASVDTGEQVFLENGEPDEEHQPTAINALIRRLLNAATRSAYVGYTATPFANIYIHEKGVTREEGPDLFPSAFIINLAAASDYVGPVRVFGLRSSEDGPGALPLTRPIRDCSTGVASGGWMPVGHPNGYVPIHEGRRSLPPSLVEAIHAFVLACAVRKLRGQGGEHCSMLVHVTRFNSVQVEVFRQIDSYMSGLRQRLSRGIGADQDLDSLRQLWERDFVPTSLKVRESVQSESGVPAASWDEVRAALGDTVADIGLRTINGTAKDALDYEEHRSTGLKVIAIGGDKLARGLTLEGLCVSYFLRASKMYDTLMQMGRWFGYRSGYLDLCRLYTTEELVRWFGHITVAGEELREEFDLMAARGGTPRDYGLKVQSHPVLMVTSRLKMRTARKLMLSFSGQLLETVALYRDSATLQSNYDAVSCLLGRLSNPEVDPRRRRGGSVSKWRGFLWRDVPAEAVVDFLGEYQTHPEAYKVNSRVLAEFVQSMSATGELTAWTVALIGGGTGASHELRSGLTIDMLERRSNAPAPDRYSIGRLLSPRDETIDLDEPAWTSALALTKSSWHADPARQNQRDEPSEPNGPAVRLVRGFGSEGVPAHPERGLLLLYFLDPARSGVDFSGPSVPVVAFGASFPGSRSGTKVEYEANNVLWEQEYGPAD